MGYGSAIRAVSGSGFQEDYDDNEDFLKPLSDRNYTKEQSAVKPMLLLEE